MCSTGGMSHNAGIWIDHKKAVIVSASEAEVTTRTLNSDVVPHPHFGGSQEGGGEKKYEERRSLHLRRYYDAVIGQLGHPDALLILGPGEAKLEFRERLERSDLLSASAIAIESAERLTDPQIVAKEQHFGLAR